MLVSNKPISPRVETEVETEEVAVANASLKKAPPMAKLSVTKVVAKDGLLVVEGSFKDSNYRHTVVTINPNTKTGTARCHFFVIYAGTMVSGEVGQRDVLSLARNARAAIDDGTLPASSAVRVLIDRLLS